MKIAVAFIATFLLTVPLLTRAQQATLQWAKQITGTSSEYARQCVFDAAGNVYVTGYFFESADLDPGPGTNNFLAAGMEDIYVTKLDPSGNPVWAMRIGGIGSDLSETVALDASGNIYVTGHFEQTVDFDPGSSQFDLTSEGEYDVFVLKLDNGGNFVWAKRIGGTDGENASALAVTSDGSIVVAGGFQGTVDFDPNAGTSLMMAIGPGDAFLCKLSGDGDFAWSKQIGSNAGQGINEVAVDASGNVYACGAFFGTLDFDPGTAVYSLTSNGASDAFLFKADPAGEFIWANAFGSPNYDHIFSVAAMDADAVYASCYLSDTTTVGSGSSAVELRHAFVAKWSADGAMTWARKASNIISISLFPGPVDVDASGNVYMLGAIYDGPILLSKLNAAGDLVDHTMIGAPYTYPYGIDVADDGTVYACGNFSQTTDFDPGAGVTEFSVTGSYDAFVLKLFLSPTSVTPVVTEANAFAHPNPTDGLLFVNITGNDPQAIKLYNAVGMLLNTYTITLASTTVDVSAQPAGLYLLEIVDGNGNSSKQKFIKH